MTEFNPMKLLHNVDLIRAKVLVGHYICETEFVRSLHRKLLEELDKMAADLVEEITAWQELTTARGTSREADFDYEIYSTCSSFEHRWVEHGAISLLDPIVVDMVAEGEGEVCRVGLDYDELPAEDLEGLPELFDRIKQDTGVKFVVARVLEEETAA